MNTTALTSQDWWTVRCIAAAVVMTISFTACDDHVEPQEVPEVNYALAFDGSSTYIEIQGVHAQRPLTLTLEMMVKFDSSHLITAPLVTTADEDLKAAAGGFSVTCAAGSVRWKVFGGPGISYETSPSLPPDTSAWHHMAFCYYYGRVWVYLDGFLVARTDLVDMVLRPVYYEGDRLLLGMLLTGDGGGRSFFRGQIDEVRLWNYARSQEQLSTFLTRKVADNVSGLVGYWNFDGTVEAGVVRDRSLTMNHGQLRGHASLVRSTAFGK